LNAPYHKKALPQGSTLREWRLEDVLGVGGFGIVYRGRGAYFDELVAIKEYFPNGVCDRFDGVMVRPADSSSEEVYALGLQKFVEEAKVLWNLSKPERHPNIVCVKSLFEINGTAYMVMDFEDGVSLSEMLRDGRRFDEASLLALIRPIAEGLDKAHRGGVVHRDIKPANILVDASGRPVLIDFGSARFDSGQATSTQVTFYTPPYAAIEQYVKTYPQGPWTDIYALGVVLYQCVTGEKPPEVLERLHGGLGEPLSAKAWPGFSPSFARAVDAAMAIMPSERPQTIPQWLKLFDASVGAGDEDDRTEVRAYLPASAVEKAPPPEPEPKAPAEPKPDAAVAAASAPEPASASAASFLKGRTLWILAAVAALPLILGVALFFRPATHRPAGGAKSATVAVAPPSGVDAEAEVVKASGLLLADAQSQNRPRPEISALSVSDAKIRALGGDLAASRDSGKRQDLATQIQAAAVGMAGGEAHALDRSADVQIRELEGALAGGPPSGEAARSLAALREARSHLGAATSKTLKAQDGATSLAEARSALSSYGGLVRAMTSAAPLIIPAKRAKVQAAVSEARALANPILANAAKPKPWVFASQARKQAYQALQDDAAQARAELASLDAISLRASSADPKTLDQALAQAAASKRSLSALYASSADSAAVK
jgi:serine/threonine protein kinase